MPSVDLFSRARDRIRLILATDLDGTFLGGDDAQRRSLYHDIEARREDLVLIYVTGRDLDFVAGLVDDPDVPSPDLVIGDVGTTVVHGIDFRPVEPVQDWIDTRWNDAGNDVRALLDGRTGLELQPIMGARRVSYYYDPDVLDASTITLVEEAGFDVVTSANRFFDVLPKGVAKGSTLLRIIDALDLPDERVLVAGDTMNDLSLFHTGLRGVAVGNSEPRLVDAISELPDVHHSAHPGCAGIADAIEMFGFFAEPATTSGT